MWYYTTVTLPKLAIVTLARIKAGPAYRKVHGMAKSRTTWTKGQSGNPSGRRKEAGAVRELAKQYTEAAIDTLAKVMEDPSAPPSARVAAAEALLARGWGKPQQSIEMSVERVNLEILKPDLASLWGRAGVRLESAKLLELPRVVEEEAA
jgi:uncharacterized protein DUF5681